MKKRETTSADNYLLEEAKRESLRDYEAEKRRNDDLVSFSGEKGIFWRMLPMDRDGRKEFVRYNFGMSRFHEIEAMYLRWLKEEWVDKGLTTEQFYEIERHADETGGPYTFIRYAYPMEIVDWVWGEYKKFTSLSPPENIEFT